LVTAADIATTTNLNMHCVYFVVSRCHL